MGPVFIDPQYVDSEDDEIVEYQGQIARCQGHCMSVCRCVLWH